MKYLSDGNIASMLLLMFGWGEEEFLATLPSKGIGIVRNIGAISLALKVVYMGDLDHYTPAIYETEHAFFLRNQRFYSRTLIPLACALISLSNNTNKSLPVNWFINSLSEFSDIVFIKPASPSCVFI